MATMNISEYKTYFLKYYVDDGNLALEAFPLGARLVNGSIIIDNDKIESDRAIPDDRRTAEIVLEIANSVTDTIKLTIDFPSNNEDGWIPNLDIQARVNNNRIEYKFFKKKMSNHLTILERSAIPERVKRCSHTQEIIRRLRNTSRDIEWGNQGRDIISILSQSNVIWLFREI